ncbi:MAG: RNA polymerase sigma factor [Phycisphaerales bacterium]
MSQGPGTFLERIAGGDAAAVGPCLDEYGSMVLGLAQRYLRPLGEDVEDAVQEVFVEVWKHAARYNPQLGSEASFIATIGHRRLIDRQRRAAARRAVSADDAGVLETKPATREGPGVSEEALRAAAAFEGLEPGEKQVIWLSICHGLSHERIASAVGIPLGTVKTRVRRGLRRLRETLERGTIGARGKGVTP